MAIVKSKKKNRVGRPPVYNLPMVRGTFRVPSETLETLKRVSDGNVTRAIIVLAKQWEDTESTPIK